MFGRVCYNYFFSKGGNVNVRKNVRRFHKYVVKMILRKVIEEIIPRIVVISQNSLNH